TGGFSGATQVAVDLVDAHLRSGRFDPLLVLRRKRQTPQDRVDALRARGLPVEEVPGYSHAATITALVRICRRFRPDILVAHGFSDHLWARYAGLMASVPHLVHVEHNPRERYTRWRLAQARWLDTRTALVIGASEGIRERLLEIGIGTGRIIAIPNGIRLAPYAPAATLPWAPRQPGIVMAARYARQKDHLTVIRACALLKARGIEARILFAGDGSARHKKAAHALVEQLGVQDNIRFLGHHADIPGLLMQNRICLLSTHYEATTLALIEGMAAGCVAIGSRVTGVEELIRHGENGFLFAEGDADDLADVLAQVLAAPPGMAAIADTGRQHAHAHHSQDLTTTRYEQALLALLRPSTDQQPVSTRP
ncbi:MAG: glycosyltransferase, partial [Comamonas sp.]